MKCKLFSETSKSLGSRESMLQCNWGRERIHMAGDDAVFIFANTARHS